MPPGKSWLNDRANSIIPTVHTSLTRRDKYRENKTQNTAQWQILTHGSDQGTQTWDRPRSILRNKNPRFHLNIKVPTAKRMDPGSHSSVVPYHKAKIRFWTLRHTSNCPSAPDQSKSLFQEEGDAIVHQGNGAGGQEASSMGSDLEGEIQQGWGTCPSGWSHLQDG